MPKIKMPLIAPRNRVRKWCFVDMWRTHKISKKTVTHEAPKTRFLWLACALSFVVGCVYLITSKHVEHPTRHLQSWNRDKKHACFNPDTFAHCGVAHLCTNTHLCNLKLGVTWCNLVTCPSYQVVKTTPETPQEASSTYMLVANSEIIFLNKKRRLFYIIWWKLLYNALWNII